MAQELGRNWKVYLNTNTHASPTWTEVTYQRGLDMGFDQQEVDGTTKGDTGWTSSIATLKDFKPSFTVQFDSTDSTHTAILAAFQGGTYKEWKIASSAGPNWIFYAYAGVSITAPHDNVVEMSVELLRFGAPTYSAT